MRWILVIADDLTGAIEAGARFAGLALARAAPPLMATLGADSMFAPAEVSRRD